MIKDSEGLGVRSEKKIKLVKAITDLLRVVTELIRTIKR